MMVLNNIHPLGLGTMRFPVSGAGDAAGIERSAEIVLRALDAGVNYIDTAHIYSRGLAHDVLKLAFSQTNKPNHVTVKVKLSIDNDHNGAMRRVEDSLNAMGISRASFFMCWSIMNFDEFKEITRKGGIYDAALKLKGEGVIDHICFSTHAPVPDVIKIIGSGLFETVTISYSLLNSAVMLPVLDKAQECGVGVVVMNPLGGGVIPQNRDFFRFACANGEDNTVQSALRYVMAYPAIKVAIAAPSSIAEFDENLVAFTQVNTEDDHERFSRVNKRLRELDEFCTGCDYCAGCPCGISVSAFMQSRNVLRFKPVKGYNRDNPELLYDIQLFKKMAMDFMHLPDTPKNPCIKCGLCEKKCTQRLKIMDALDDTYRRIERTAFSVSGRRGRFELLLREKGYGKVGFYPAGGYTVFVLEQYRKIFGLPEFDCVLFDTNPSQWGKSVNGMVINPPDKIGEIRPDCILISNYNYDNEIYESIKHFENEGITILKLHEMRDVPWVF